MTLIYVSDIVPILITAIIFSLAATAHRVLLPNQYSSFLQFKGEEDDKKSIQSTCIRIIYLVIGTSVLHFIGFSEEQILIGIFIACFLNVWPAIDEYHLLKLNKPGTEWFLLAGYVCFIGWSVLIGYVTISFIIPSLSGATSYTFLGNPWISALASILMLALPVPLESFFAKHTHLVMEEKIDTFKEEITIIEREINTEYPRIKRNKHEINKVAKKYNINAKLLATILKLEIFYRDRMYYQIPERLLCTVLKNYAIKKDVSIGIGQIRISTAGNILEEDPHDFIKELLDDKFNIDVCGKYLQELIEECDQYNPNDDASEDKNADVYNYIARRYLGGAVHSQKRTVLIYSAVLRSILSGEELNYSDETKIE